jgi:hypothetical protein
MHKISADLIHAYVQNMKITCTYNKSDEYLVTTC